MGGLWLWVSEIGFTTHHRCEKSSQLINLNVCQLRNDIIQSLGHNSGGLKFAKYVWRVGELDCMLMLKLWIIELWLFHGNNFEWIRESASLWGDFMNRRRDGDSIVFIINWINHWIWAVTKKVKTRHGWIKASSQLAFDNELLLFWTYSPKNEAVIDFLSHGV